MSDTFESGDRVRVKNTTDWVGLVTVIDPWGVHVLLDEPVHVGGFKPIWHLRREPHQLELITTEETE